jgi:hypothetical protein
MVELFAIVFGEKGPTIRRDHSLVEKIEERDMSPENSLMAMKVHRVKESRR